jgi:hypothetical protein
MVSSDLASNYVFYAFFLCCYARHLKGLYDVLEQANSPAGLLVVKMREMEEGTFVGKVKADKDWMISWNIQWLIMVNGDLLVINDWLMVTNR